MTTKSSQPGMGWAYLRQTRKNHYFGLDGESLCRRWIQLFDNIVDVADDSDANCISCQRKLVKLREREAP